MAGPLVSVPVESPRESTPSSRSSRPRERPGRWSASSEYFRAESHVPIGIHYGPDCPDDDALGLLPDVEGADAVELGCAGAQCAVGLARRGPRA